MAGKGGAIFVRYACKGKGNNGKSDGRWMLSAHQNPKAPCQLAGRMQSKSNFFAARIGKTRGKRAGVAGRRPNSPITSYLKKNHHGSKDKTM